MNTRAMEFVGAGAQNFKGTFLFWLISSSIFIFQVSYYLAIYVPLLHKQEFCFGFSKKRKRIQKTTCPIWIYITVKIVEKAQLQQPGQLCTWFFLQLHLYFCFLCSNMHVFFGLIHSTLHLQSGLILLVSEPNLVCLGHLMPLILG